MTDEEIYARVKAFHDAAPEWVDTLEAIRAFALMHGLDRAEVKKAFYREAKKINRR